jgi:F0F1-type ATP synthase membrane subunit b/b'
MTEPVTTNRDMSNAEEALRLAKEVADRLVAEARQQAGEITAKITAEARAKGDEIIAAARGEAETIVQEARVTAGKEAQQKLDELMEATAESRKDLEERVAKLKAFERDYRSHLLEYMEGQVTVLKAGVFGHESHPE